MNETPSVGASFGVVIPTVGRAEMVRAQVDLLRQLDGAPEQIVVVCDGAGDSTAASLRSMSAPPTIVATAGVGPASARNLGVEHTSCEWLIFLDDDDHPGPAWMTTFRTLLAAEPDAVYLSTGFVRRVDGGDHPMRPHALGAAFRDQVANFVAGTFAVRTSLFGSIGGFSEGLRCMEFTDLALRLFERVDRDQLVIAHSPDTTVTIVVRPPHERSSQDPHVLDAAWRRVEHANRQQFDADPEFHADQLSSLGVAWMRSGDARAARRYLFDAARRHPDRRTASRALIAAVPGLGQRIWRGPVSGSGGEART